MMIPSAITKERATQHHKRIVSLGFRKPHNFLLWLFLSGCMVSFSLSRIMYINIDGYLCQPNRALPGECYFWQPQKHEVDTHNIHSSSHRRGKAGILLHLVTILPASLLAVLQFIPILRKKFVTFHRLNGYLITLLSVAGMVGELMIAKNTFGGTLEMQTVTGLATIMFLGCLALALWHVKRLDIEQHRAWMLRAWAIASHVITMRLIAKLMAFIASRPQNHHYAVRSCAVLDSIFHNDQHIVEELYPACSAFYTGLIPSQHVLIEADMTSGRLDHIVAGLGVTFAAAAWLALSIHCVAAEVYLAWTSGEAERLREVSRRRQGEAKMERLRQRGAPATSWDIVSEKGRFLGRDVDTDTN